MKKPSNKKNSGGAPKKPFSGVRSPKNKTTRSPRSENADDETELVRLNKYIADAGICSRREADKHIADGAITVNGQKVTEVGTKVRVTDTVKFNNKVLKKERFVYILLNKPKDYITTSSDEIGRKTVLDLIGDACSERVYPVGRLDRNTTGLLLLTNDGELTKRLTHPSYNVVKTYVAELDQAVTKEHLAQLTAGFELEDGFTKFDSAEYDMDGSFKNSIMVTIHSGKNRIVRRSFEHLGYEVKKLDRIGFSNLKKGAITRGKWRFLTKKEVGFLKMVK